MLIPLPAIINLGQLPVPWRLRGPRQAILGSCMSPLRLQDQIPREFLPPQRKPRVRGN